MKTPFSLIILSALCWSAQANEFRNITLGDNCSNIEINESSYGSIPKSTWKRENGEYIFEGNYQGYDAKIIYYCSNGTLIKGAYIIKSLGIDNSKLIFNELRQYLSTIHGDPIADTTKTNTQEVLEAFGISDVMKSNEAIVSWDKISYQVGLSLNDSADTKPIIMVYIK